MRLDLTVNTYLHSLVTRRMYGETITRFYFKLNRSSIKTTWSTRCWGNLFSHLKTQKKKINKTQKRKYFKKLKRINGFRSCIIFKVMFYCNPGNMFLIVCCRYFSKPILARARRETRARWRRRTDRRWHFSWRKRDCLLVFFIIQKTILNNHLRV